MLHINIAQEKMFIFETISGNIISSSVLFFKEKSYALFVIIFCISTMIFFTHDARSDDNDVELPEELKEFYKKYLNNLEPLYFAVAIDGSYAGYTYCDFGCNRANARRDATRTCEQGGVDCYMYAIANEVVWSRGPFNGYGNKNSEVQAKVSDIDDNTPAKDKQIRSIAISWEGFDDIMIGEIEFIERKNRGNISMNWPNSENLCTGSYTFGSSSNGSWSIACTNNISASGFMKLRGYKLGSTGEGVDTKGRKVKFTVAADR